jgi:uncharacterized membrane protein
MSIIIWLLVIGSAIWFAKYAIDHNIFNFKNLDPKIRAFELLKKRYASGEIKMKQYEDEKRDLKL